MSDLRDQWAAAVIRDRALTRGCKLTAFALREYANARGRTTASLNRIAKDTGQGRRTVIRHMSLLAERGYLNRIEHGGAIGRGGRTALTQFVVPGLLLSPEVVPAETPRLYRKQCPQEPEVVSPQARSGAKLVAPKPINHMNHGADARAAPRGARAAPRTTTLIPNDVGRTLARSLIAASTNGLGYPDEYIREKCGLSQQELDDLRDEFRGYCLIA